jgi:hypothetical protein
MTLLQSSFRVAVAAAAAALLAPSVTASKAPPSTGQDWISLHKGAEFQPAQHKDIHKQTQLRRAQERFLEEQQQSEQQLSYVDSQETYYEAYAQAWRYLGFYTDCNPNQNRDRRGRKLNEGEESGCSRFLLWAAVSLLV